jgi:hypothetical protein
MPGDYDPSRCCALLIPSGTISSPDKLHLYFLVTSRCPANCHLAISVSTIKEGISFDPTRVFEPGEHPFIRFRSYGFYARPEQLRAERIIAMVKGWIYKRHDDCSQEFYVKLSSGLLESPFTPRWAKNYFLDNRRR